VQGPERLAEVVVKPSRLAVKVGEWPGKERALPETSPARCAADVGLDLESDQSMASGRRCRIRDARSAHAGLARLCESNSELPSPASVLRSPEPAGALS
jgi:hypothetical protein